MISVAETDPVVGEPAAGGVELGLREPQSSPNDVQSAVECKGSYFRTNTIQDSETDRK